MFAEQPLDKTITYSYNNGIDGAVETIKGSVRCGINSFELQDIYKLIGRSACTAPFEKGIHNDKELENFEKWLLDNGAEFPDLELCSMGESVFIKLFCNRQFRGMYLRRDVNRGDVLVKIPSKFIISCDMGRDCETSKGLREENTDFESSKHIYMANFLLEDMENENSFYKPYYDTLPKDITNIPMLWSNDEINQLHGSCFVICE